MTAPAPVAVPPARPQWAVVVAKRPKLARTARRYLAQVEVSIEHTHDGENR